MTSTTCPSWCHIDHPEGESEPLKHFGPHWPPLRGEDGLPIFRTMRSSGTVRRSRTRAQLKGVGAELVPASGLANPVARGLSTSVACLGSGCAAGCERRCRRPAELPQLDFEECRAGQVGSSLFRETLEGEYERRGLAGTNLVFQLTQRWFDRVLGLIAERVKGHGELLRAPGKAHQPALGLGPDRLRLNFKSA